MHTNYEPRRFLFVLGAARRDGNTEILARRAAAQLPGDVEQRWIHLDDVPLPPFADRRHDGGRHVAADGNERLLLDATLAATDLVIASPLYWYSVSATVKLYLDYWSGWMRSDNFKPRMGGKTLWGVSVLSEEAPQADPLVDMLHKSADYLSMHWGGVLLGNGSKPGDVLTDATGLADAKTFFNA